MFKPETYMGVLGGNHADSQMKQPIIPYMNSIDRSIYVPVAGT